MFILFDKAFLKSLDKVNNKIVKHRIEENTIKFIVIAHRKDIYRIYP